MTLSISKTTNHPTPHPPTIHLNVVNTSACWHNIDDLNTRGRLSEIGYHILAALLSGFITLRPCNKYSVMSLKPKQFLYCVGLYHYKHLVCSPNSFDELFFFLSCKIFDESQSISIFVIASNWLSQCLKKTGYCFWTAITAITTRICHCWGHSYKSGSY